MMTEIMEFAGKQWPATGRGYVASMTKPLCYVALTEEVPGVEEYRWFLWRTGQPTVQFTDIWNAHAYVTGHGVVLDFIERFEP